MTETRWPALRVDDWTATRETLLRWMQIVGKIRLAQAPMVNHWWQVTLYVTPRGLTTSAMPSGERRHVRDRVRLLRAPAEDHAPEGGEQRELALEPKTVAAFYAEVLDALASLGLAITIWPVPVEIEDADPVRSGHRARELRPGGREPVLAAARPGRPRDDQVPRALQRQGQPRALLLGRDGPGGDAVLGPDRAAPSRRSPQLRRLGDGRGLLARAGQLRLLAGRRGGRRLLRLRLPGARRLTAPRRSTPEAAFYSAEYRQFLLPYEAVRTAADPDASLLEFLQTTYDAAADLGHWDRAALEYVPVEGARPNR